MADSIGHKKKAMVQALVKSYGIVTKACEDVGLSRDTHYRWLKEDPEYAQEVTAIEDVALDFAESELHKRIKEGDTTATIFFLKTKGRRRGYNERQDVNLSGSVKTVVDFRGDIDDLKTDEGISDH